MIDLPLPAGLVAVVGDEGTGKTRCLRELAGCLYETVSPAPGHDGLWLDLGLPGLDKRMPQQVWEALATLCPRWSAVLLQELAAVLQLQPHRGKTLSMLSTGTRRKVALAGLLSAGTTLTCLDQPYAALDMASIQVIRGFLLDQADHPTRTWAVADYEADAHLPWRRVIRLS